MTVSLFTWKGAINVMFNIPQKCDQSATVQTGMNRGITNLKSLK